MITRLHKCARTTPRVRAEIAASNDSVATLAQRYGVSPATILKWKHRTDFEDRPHTAHRLQTTLTPAQEMIVVELRKTLWLSLDDLLAVTREFINPDVSRSGLDRCACIRPAPLGSTATLSDYRGQCQATDQGAPFETSTDELLKDDRSDRGPSSSGDWA